MAHATPSMQPDEVRSHIDALGPWFHNLRLDGVETAPGHYLGDFPSTFFRHFAHRLPEDLRGWRVLDVGCNAGFYAFEMKRRGAAHVLGIDADPRYVRQARFAAARLGYEDVEFQERSVYEVAELGGPFDLVLFMGVLYHLRHPLLALDLLRRHAVGRLLVFQSLIRGDAVIAPVQPDYDFHDSTPFSTPGFPRLQFIERQFAQDWTNWWVPNRACAEAMLRSAGFEIVDNPVPEVYLCRPSGPGPDVPRIVTEQGRA
ncbi:MAG TPA: TIGR04290 family methyltransferase [Vicinamibacterales bacterium]